MKKIVFLLFVACMAVVTAKAWRNMPMPKLHIEGRYLVDENGNKVNLHGVAQTYSPWFNEKGKYWDNYDVDNCLKYNKRVLDGALDKGYKINVLRLHMDPYWSNNPSANNGNESDISAFNMLRFKQYFNSVFYEMAKYCEANGIYVVMRPPGVCPEEITVGDNYQKYLIKVWEYVADRLVKEGNTSIMIELANEPIRICKTDASGNKVTTGASADYFQPIVDAIRAKGCNNIIWVPGPGYQSDYRDYAVTPITGDNIGYAVHCYPGWFGSDAEVESAENTGDVSGGGYNGFINGWHERINCVTDFAPIIVTEMDWAAKKYDCSWGKSTTGVRGGEGFGANFKFLCDYTGNVSWTVFTGLNLLAEYDDSKPDGSTFLTDPESCARPVYRWFKDYAAEWPNPTEDARKLVSLELGCADNFKILPGNAIAIPVDATFADGHKSCVSATADYSISNPSVASFKNGMLLCNGAGETDVVISLTDDFGTRKEVSVHLTLTPFPLTADSFNPNIWEKGSFDENTGTLITGKYGFGGWTYNNGFDMSGYKYLVVELYEKQNVSAEIHLFDENDYWAKNAAIQIGTRTRVVEEIATLKKSDGVALNPKHIYIAGFWSYGGKPIKIKNVFLSNDKDATGPSTGIGEVEALPDCGDGVIYNLRGQRVVNPTPGIYIKNGKKIVIN